MFGTIDRYRKEKGWMDITDMWLGVWCLSGRFGALRPEDRRFESHSSCYGHGSWASPSLAVALLYYCIWAAKACKCTSELPVRRTISNLSCIVLCERHRTESSEVIIFRKPMWCATSSSSILVICQTTSWMHDTKSRSEEITIGDETEEMEESIYSTTTPSVSKDFWLCKGNWLPFHQSLRFISFKWMKLKLIAIWCWMLCKPSTQMWGMQAFSFEMGHFWPV